jgi:hypothetical protein
MSHDDLDLERLLARGNLGGATYDRIESNVMQRVSAPTERRRPAWLWAAALPLAAALGVLALFFRTPSEPATDSAGFTAKGSNASPAGGVELTCAADRPCRAGDTLMFVIDTSAAHGYLNASAQRIEPGSPERIRLFPTEKGESPRVEAGVGTTVVPQGLRLGPAFTPGVYRVDVWFTEAGPSPHPGEGRPISVELTLDD